MKKFVLITILLLANFLLLSCATMHAGKIVKSSACKKITHKKKNSHHFKLTHVAVDYNYKIEPSKQMISFEGAIDKLPYADRKRTLKRFLHADFYVTENKKCEDATLDIFFMDAGRKVLSAKRIQLEKSPVIKFPILFQADAPYSKEYKYIALAYKFTFTSTNPKAVGMKKVYSHELDIQ